MLNLVLFLAAAGQPAIPAKADPYQPPARVVLAERVDRLCRNAILSKPELANAVIGAASGSMSEVCECTTMLTVSALSDADVSALGKDLDKVNEVVSSIAPNLSRCVQMAPFK